MIHAVHSNNMSVWADFGSPCRDLLTMLIVSLALAGIFPLAGFWSKDELLVVAHETGTDWVLSSCLVTRDHHGVSNTMRMVLLTFFGSYVGEAHTLTITADMACPPRLPRRRALVGLGLLGAPSERRVGQWCSSRRSRRVFVPWIAALSTVGALGGLALGWILYRERAATDPLESRWVRCGPCSSSATTSTLLHRRIIYPVRGHMVQGVYWSPARPGCRGERRRDGFPGPGGPGDVVRPQVIDGIVNGSGRPRVVSGRALKYLQTGSTSSGTRLRSSSASWR